MGGLVACSSLHEDSGAFRDRGDDYQHAREVSPVQIPEGMVQRSLSHEYDIPSLSMGQSQTFIKDPFPPGIPQK